MGTDYLGGQFTAACLSAGTSSFADFLAASAPGLLPAAAAAAVPGAQAAGQAASDLPHGTTIVAVDFDGGVIMAGDRRSTAGSMIAQRDIEKVFRSDDTSCVGISGVAGTGLELVRLFQLELEHYEKLEGRTLSLEGKANRLAAFVRGNLSGAMQGLVVVPLFAGLKKLYTEGMTEGDAITVCMQALYDAADDDSATGGPDLTRHIYPVVAVVTEDGFRRLTDDEAGEYAQAVVDERMQSPGGPTAPLRSGGASNSST